MIKAFHELTPEQQFAYQAGQQSLKASMDAHDRERVEWERRAEQAEAALEAIIEVRYDNYRKGDYASFIRDLARSGLAPPKEKPDA